MCEGKQRLSVRVERVFMREKGEIVSERERREKKEERARKR